MPPKIRRSLHGRRRTQGDSKQLLSAVLAGILLVVSLGAISRRVRPVLMMQATAAVTNGVTAAVQTAIANGITTRRISYEDMVTVKTDTQGRVTLLSSNLEQTNLLRAGLLELVLESVSDLSEEDFSIPVGNLTGIDLLSGIGPSVSVRVLSMGTAVGEFSHEFTAAGVNQTIHRILLNLEVVMRVFLPGETLTLPVTTSVCVAETIIVGEVPETYLNWEP